MCEKALITLFSKRKFSCRRTQIVFGLKPPVQIFKKCSSCSKHFGQTKRAIVSELI